MGRKGHLLLVTLLFAVPLWGRNYANVSTPSAGTPLALPAEGITGDFFVECHFRPKEPVFDQTLLELTLGTTNCRLALLHGQLSLMVEGRVFSRYPLYHAGCLPLRLKAGDNHILLQREAGALSAFVDGYPMQAIDQTHLDTPLLRFVPGQSIVRLHISSGHIPPSEVRTRYLEQVQGRQSIRSPSPPLASVPHLTEHPVLDGVPDNGLPTAELPMRSSSPKQKQQWQARPVTVRLARFQDSLYLFWDIRDDRKPWLHTYGKRDAPLWNLESVELFLMPPGANVPFQFIVSAGGELYDAHGEDKEWNASVEWAVAPRQDGWSGELLLATGTASLPGLQDGTFWKANFFASRQWRAWSPVAPFSDHSRYGLLHFVNAVPAVKSLNLTCGADGCPEISGEILTAHPCQMALHFYPPGEVEPETIKALLTSDPGWQPFCIRFPGTAKTSSGGFAWTLTSPDNQMLFRHSGLLPQ